MYYEVAPPSERNKLNLSLLSSAPETEIRRNVPKDLGRPLTDIRAVLTIGREIIGPKSDSLAHRCVTCEFKYSTVPLYSKLIQFKVV